jgi:hypothetical protein
MINRTALALGALLGLCSGCASMLDGPTTSALPAVHRQAGLTIRETDARWSSFGAYLGTLSEAVETEWHKWTPPNGDFPSIISAVEIRFVLNSKGEVSEIKTVRPTPGTPPGAVAACINALKSNSPFPAWTPAMVAVLGDEQTVTLEFSYR